MVLSYALLRTSATYAVTLVNAQFQRLGAKYPAPWHQD